MENRILFVNKRAKLIEEFLVAMEGTDFVIKTALNGFDAVQLLKEQEYKVVITGLIMEKFDGNQLISYINQEYPSTACVVLTTKMNVGQLAFLVNQLDVYRIYLRPVDLKGQFLEMLKDAFIYYNNHYHYMQKQFILQSSRGQSDEKLHHMQLIMGGIEEANLQFEKFANGVLDFSMKQVNIYEENVKKKLLAFEKHLIRQYLQLGKKELNHLDDVEKQLQLLIPQNGTGVIEMTFPEENLCTERMCGNLYFVIWLLQLTISSIVHDYKIEVKCENVGKEKIEVFMNIELQMDQWKKLSASIVGKRMVQILNCFVEGLTSS